MFLEVVAWVRGLIFQNHALFLSACIVFALFWPREKMRRIAIGGLIMEIAILAPSFPFLRFSQQLRDLLVLFGISWFLGSIVNALLIRE